MLVAANLMPADYYELPKKKALDALIEMYLPSLLDWRDLWLGESRMRIQIIECEHFLGDPIATINDIGGFHELTFTEPKLPTLDKSTHFRRGLVGSYLDELSEQQIERVNGMITSGYSKE